MKDLQEIPEKDQNNKEKFLMRPILLSIMCISIVPVCFAKSQASDKKAQLFEAARVGNLSEVKRILADSDIDVEPALLVASQNGHLEVVKLLLESGNEDLSMRAPLFKASQMGHTEIVKLLLENDIDSDSVSLANFIASEEGQTEVVKLLLDNGAKVNVAWASGTTPLMIASKNGHAEVVRLLLKKGAEVNVRSPEGTTALWIASTSGHTDVVRLLLEKGSDVNVKATEMDITPLWSASSNGHTGIVKLLLDNGADTEIKTNDTTPLDVARSGGHAQIVELLEMAAGQKLAAKTDTTDETNDLSSTAKQVEDKIDLADYYCQNGKYTIGLPVNWTKEEEEITPGIRGLIVLSPNESPSDPFSENINIIVIPADTKDLNALLERSIRLGQETMPQFQLIDKGFSRMGTNDVAWRISSQDFQGQTQTVLKVLMINQSNTCLVTCTALADAFDTYRPVFNQIISSIRFDKVKAGSPPPTSTPVRGVDMVDIGRMLGALVGTLAGLIVFISLFRKKEK